MLNDLITWLSSLFRDSLGELNSKAMTIESDVQDIKEDLHLLRENMRRYEERLSILPFIQERIDTLPSCFASSIMLQLEHQSREQHQLQTTRLESAQILNRIDSLVRTQ